jgi:hypothetical protein
MQNLHHVSIMAYYVDGQPADPVGAKRAGRKTAMGIYAADKVMSKGGKLTLRASIPGNLNGGKLPTLKEAAAILRGETIEQSDAWRDPSHAMIFVRQALRLEAAATANGCSVEEAKRGMTFKEVRGDYVATVRKSSGNRGVFWLASLTHKGARIESDLRYNGAEQAQALAVAWLNKHSPLPAAPATLSTDESAPRTDSAVVNMLLAQRVAAAAAPALNANGHIGECTLADEEWAGTPASDDPDGAWICDDCGARIPASPAAVADLDRAMIDALPPKEDGRGDLPALPHDIVTASLLRRLLQGQGFTVGALAVLPGRYFVSQHGKFSGDYGSEAEAWQAVIALADSQL